MSKVETVTFAEIENDAQVPQAPENYTSVNGIYGSVIAPQFLNAKDNVHYLPVELLKAEQEYRQRQDLRFFRML